MSTAKYTILITFIITGIAAPLGISIAAQDTIPEYIRFSEIGFRSNQSYDVVRTISYDESNRIAVVDGGIGFKINPCENGYYCFFFSEIFIAIPEKCTSTTNDSWVYKQYKYDIVNNLDSYNPMDTESINNTRFLIKVSKKHRTLGYFIYSPRKGVHSFVFSSGNKFIDRFEHFHLTSSTGMLRNGCAIPSPSE